MGLQYNNNTLVPLGGISGYVTANTLSTVTTGIKIGSNVFYVDPSGNNTTAVKGNPTCPYATISSALSAAESGQTVYASPGTYNEQVTFKNGVELYLEAGATVTYTGAPTFTDNGSGIGTFRIAGHGSLQNVGAQPTGSVILISNDSNTVYVECQDILLSTSQACTGASPIVLVPTITTPFAPEILSIDFSTVNVAIIIDGGMQVSDGDTAQQIQIVYDPTVPLSDSPTDTTDYGLAPSTLSNGSGFEWAVCIGVQDSPSASAMAAMFASIVNGTDGGGFVCTSVSAVATLTITDSSYNPYNAGGWYSYFFDDSTPYATINESQTMVVSTTTPALTVGTAALGPGGGGAVNYCIAGIFSGNGYLQVNCEHIVCAGCPVLVRTGNGKFFLNAGDEIQTSGTGISTIVIGDGTPAVTGQLEQPGWVNCDRLLSDPNERVLSVEGFPYVMVLYVNAHRIG